MTKEQYADKLLRYIQSYIDQQCVVLHTQSAEFYLTKIKEYFEEFGDSYTPNAQDIELADKPLNEDWEKRLVKLEKFLEKNTKRRTK